MKINVVKNIIISILINKEIAIIFSFLIKSTISMTNANINEHSYSHSHNHNFSI